MYKLDGPTGRYIRNWSWQKPLKSDKKFICCKFKIIEDFTGLVPGFVTLKRIDAAAIAAAVSPASSDPGADVVIAHAGRGIVMSSGRPQYLWSSTPSPT